jgi:hypothetical protein
MVRVLTNAHRTINLHARAREAAGHWARCHTACPVLPCAAMISATLPPGISSLS